MAEPPLIGKREFEQKGPVIRLVFCFVCNTIEELPPHDGPPESDVLLEITVEKHAFPSGEPHKGKMFLLPVATWAKEEHRKAIIRQLRGEGATGLDAMTEDADFYSTKMTFAEDAMKCYNYHLRPTDGCSDYQSDEKRLLPKTAKERIDLGMPSPAEAGGPKVFLCNFCPVQSIITTKRRSMMGLYDE
jgi:hypothetical protein